MQTELQYKVMLLLDTIAEIRKRWSENNDISLNGDYKINYGELYCGADQSQMKNLAPCEVCGANDRKEDTINVWFNNDEDGEGANFIWCGNCGQCNYWTYYK